MSAGITSKATAPPSTMASIRTVMARGLRSEKRIKPFIGSVSRHGGPRLGCLDGSPLFQRPAGPDDDAVFRAQAGEYLDLRPVVGPVTDPDEGDLAAPHDPH